MHGSMSIKFLNNNVILISFSITLSFTVAHLKFCTSFSKIYQQAIPLHKGVAGEGGGGGGGGRLMRLPRAAK